MIARLLALLAGLLVADVQLATSQETVAFAAKEKLQLQRAVAAKEEQLTRLAEQRLREFYRQQWNIVEKLQPRVDNWHVDAICDHLQATIADVGQTPHITRLVINVPPRNSKSSTTCVALPAWTWGPRNIPGKRFMYITHSLRLARRDSVLARRVITSGWYQTNWGDRFQLRGDQKTKERFENNQTGYRMIGSFHGGSVIGEGADVLGIDDPIDPDSADNPNELERIIETYDGALVGRLNDQIRGVIILIMQRLAENDLCGHVLQQAGWQHLRLPTEFELEARCRTFVFTGGEKRLFFEDPRAEEAELLNPLRFPREAVDILKINEWVFAAQQQQRPAPRGGQILQEQWWQYFDELPRDAEGQPRKPDHGAQSWDLAFKDLKTSDFVAAIAGELYGADIYLTDYLMERASFSRSCELLAQWDTKHPHLDAKLVEDKANGPAVADALAREISGIVLVNPEGGKIARAFAAQPTLKSKNVFLPNPTDPATGKLIPERAWVQRFVKNCATFPKGLHDDDVDAFTQLVNYLRSTRTAMLDFMKQMKARDDAKKQSAEGTR